MLGALKSCSWLSLPFVGTFLVYVLFAWLFPNDRLDAKDTVFVFASLTALAAIGTWIKRKLGRIGHPGGEAAPER